MTRLEHLEKLLSEATHVEHTMEKELVILSALRNAAPAMLRVIRAAKAAIPEMICTCNNVLCCARCSLVDEIEKF